MCPKLFMLLLFCALSEQYKATRKPKAFTCVGKVIGGYYADIQSGCQMFHVCTLDQNVELQDIVFRCIHGTVFEQETRVCERTEEVNCENSEDFYYLNDDLYGPGIIPDTANDNSFKTSGQVMTLNGPVILPTDYLSYMTSSKNSFVRISHPTSTWSIKLPMQSSASSYPCDSKTRSGFYADVELDCSVFHLCIELKNGRLKLKESHVCLETDTWFDENVGKCVTRLQSKCGNAINKIDSTLQITGQSEDIRDLCKKTGYNGLIPDIRNNCRRYFKCTLIEGKVFLESFDCKQGFSYSPEYKKCINEYKNDCKIDSLIVRPHNQYDVKIRGTNFNLRFRRSSLFEKQKKREASSGSLTPADGIFSDQASVIDNQSPGNLFVEGSSIRKKDRKHKSGTASTKAFTHQRSHTKDKTSVNGTVVEISEISAPDQNGKVTITSIVPKFIRSNGNNQQTDPRTKLIVPEISVSTFQSKVTVSGINATASDLQINEKYEITDLKNNLGNESLMDNETILNETSSTSDADLDSSTVVITTFEPTKLIEEPATKSTTVAPTTKQPDTTQLTPNEIIETNFTCRDKILERFYPDIEAECKVFHYCAPGFSDDQVLDLKFLCTGNTRFDSASSKCQNENDVICETPTVLHGLPQPSIELKVTRPQTTSSTSTPTPTQSTQTESITTSTHKHTSTITTTETSTPVVSSSTPSVITTIDNSTSPLTDTKYTNASTGAAEESSKLSNVQSSTTDTTLNSDQSSTTGTTLHSDQSSDTDMISTYSSPEPIENSTSVPTISTSRSTSNITTEETNTPFSKQESSADENIMSTINIEKALYTKGYESILENETLYLEEPYQMVNEDIYNQNISIKTDLIEANEEKTNLQLENEKTTLDIILEFNALNNDSIDDISRQNESTSLENYQTDAAFAEIITSTPEIINQTIFQNILEETLNSTDTVTETISNALITDNLTSLLIDN